FRVFSFALFSVFSGLWLCLLLGYMTLVNVGTSEWTFLGGGIGLQIAQLSHEMFGWGTFLVLILSLFVFIIFFFNITAIPAFTTRDPKPMGSDAIVAAAGAEVSSVSGYVDEQDNWAEKQENQAGETQTEEPSAEEEEATEPVILVKTEKEKKVANDLTLEVETPKEKEKTEPEFTVNPPTDTEKLAEQLVEEQGAYDPTLELSNFQFPTLDLLNEYDGAKAGVSQEELNQNKDKIVATLVN